MTIEKKRGRPTEYNDEIAAEICEELAFSDGGLRGLCEQNPHWPDRRNIYRWLQKYPEFRLQYAYAKEFQIDFVLMDSITDITRDRTNDFYIHTDGKIHSNNVYARLMCAEIDYIKWKAARLLPKKYGDRIRNEHTGKDGEPIQQEIKTNEVTKLIDIRISEITEKSREENGN